MLHRVRADRRRNVHCLAEGAIAHEAAYPGRASEYGAGLSGVLETAGEITAAELGKAHILRDRFAGQVAEVFRDIDVLLIPVMATPTPTTAEWDEMATGDLAPALRYTAPFNSTGVPALTMNGGFDKRGAPIGFQLIGKICRKIYCFGPGIRSRPLPTGTPVIRRWTEARRAGIRQSSRRSRRRAERGSRYSGGPQQLLA
jgi:Asp-tRNA(Asn)/Glu-tRNA(Gln) amidotransferase A subunit family amidase